MASGFALMLAYAAGMEVRGFPTGMVNVMAPTIAACVVAALAGCCPIRAGTAGGERRAADGRRACARSVTGLISAAAPHAPPSGCAAPLVEELFASRLRPALRRAAFAVSCNDASWLASRSCEAAKAGGRGWDRTSDPYDVNVVLSR